MDLRIFRSLLFNVWWGACCVTLACGCAAVGSRAEAPARTRAGAVAYLSLLQNHIEHARTQMPAMITSAEVCAKRVVGGGRIFAAGSQPDFPAELIGRAGGLMALEAPPRQLKRGDVVLYGVRSRLSVNDNIRIDRWRREGVYVVAFASAISLDRYFPPDTLIDSGPVPGIACVHGQLAPADSVINLINAWTWTGEFVAACTRLGKMPVMYQSYGLPGGRDRAAWYRGRLFHDDVKVSPVGSGVLGNAYLDVIEGALTAVENEAPPVLSVAAEWLRQTPPERCELWAAGHLFPDHYADPRAPQPFGKTDGVQITRTPAAPVAVVLGHQDAPQIAIDAATMRRTRLLYTSAQRGDGDRRDGIYFIDPHWPAEDACVAVNGYDVPILPASGVMQAAIYWSLLAEAFAPTTSGQPIATSVTPGE